MKKINILIVFFTMALLFGACEDTNENLVGSRGIAVIPEISALSPAAPTFTDLTANSFITFTVSLPEGEAVEAAEIQVVYKGKTALLQKIASFPANLKVTAPEMITALGISASDVDFGTSFLIYVITTSQGISSRSSAIVEVKLPCEFDHSLAFGNFHAKSAGWNSEGDITITADPNDPYVVYVSGLETIEDLVEDRDLLKMVINPSNFNVTAETAILASDAWGYGYISYGGTGIFNSCDGTYEMNFEITLETLGSQGSYKFILTKN